MKKILILIILSIGIVQAAYLDSVSINNWPSSFGRTWSLLNTTDSVNVGNFPSSFSISNFPSTQPVSASSLPLPSGASTATLQTLGNSSLSSIDGKTPSLGQALAASSIPVVLTTAQLSTLTPLASIGVNNFPSTQAITATSLPLPSGAATESTLSTLNGKIPSNLTVNSTRLLIDGSGVTQPISSNYEGPVSPGTASSKSALIGGQYNSTLPVLTTGQQSALQIDNNGRIRASVVDDSSFASGSVSTTGTTVGINNGQNYHMYTVSITGTWVGILITQISVDGVTWKTVNSYDPFTGYTYASVLSNMTVQVPGGTDHFQVLAYSMTSGAANIAIEASNAQGLTQVVQQSGASLQTTTKLNDASGNSIYNGQNLMANSLPVTIASNQTTLPVSGSFYQSVQPISATTLPLPSGAATSALQTTGNSSLSSIDGKTPSLGQSTMIASSPVVIASNQSSIPVTGAFYQGTQPISATTLPLPAGAATESTLSLLNGKVTAVDTGNVTIASALPIGTNSIGTVQAPTITKGTQGSTGFMVQNLLDSGRTNKQFSATFISATTEAMVTLTPIVEGTAGATGNSFTPSVGKTFRLQSLCVSIRNAGAAAQGLVIQLRRSNTATVTTASSLVGTVAAGTGIAITNVSNSNCMSFSDGIEWTNGQYFGVSQVGSNTANNTVVLSGFEY
jgi:hypothetical protein